MRILVTNDDGIHATGLKVLEAIARQLSDDVWICAPSEEQSGAGHSLTLTRPVRLRRRRCSTDRSNRHEKARRSAMDRRAFFSA